MAGDKDQSLLSTRGPDWFTDGFHLSPSPKDLLTLPGGEHSLGGITGYGVTETTDEDPERVALVRRASTAYLRKAFWSWRRGLGRRAARGRDRVEMTFGIMTAPMQVGYADILRVWREADAIPEIAHAWLFDHLMPIGGDPDGPIHEAGRCSPRSRRRPHGCASACW